MVNTYYKRHRRKILEQVKGYWTVESLKKFKLFKEAYPHIKLTVLKREDLLRKGIHVK